MKYRDFMTMTDEEVRRIVTDIFKPKKITRIRKYKRSGYITCNIYTEWDPQDPIVICDELTMRDPFEWTHPLSVDFSIDSDVTYRYTQFCFSLGMCKWLKDNPYLQN